MDYTELINSLGDVHVFTDSTYLVTYCRESKYAIESQAKRIAELEAAQEESYVNAKGIAAFMALNYFSDVPNWSAMNDVRGVLSQISNMVTGLQRKKAAQAQAVPDVKEVPETNSCYDDHGNYYETGYAYGWNDCRNEMLTAAPTPAAGQQSEPVAYVDINYGILRCGKGYDLPVGAKLYDKPQPPAANAAPTRHPNDELVSMFCTAIDNLGDMPISPEWAESFAERGHKLLADNNYFRDANTAQGVRNQTLEEAAKACENQKVMVLRPLDGFSAHDMAKQANKTGNFLANKIRALKTPAKQEA